MSATIVQVVTCMAERKFGAEVGQMLGAARAFSADEALWAVYHGHKGPLGRTRLMYAAKVGQLERAQFLLERGAVVDEGNEVGATALMLASGYGEVAVARLLVERGGACVNAAKMGSGATALMLASQDGHLEIVRLLVECEGIDVNAASTDVGVTALMLASENGHLPLVLLLLQHAADKSLENDQGETALQLAEAHPLVRVALA